MHRRHRLEEAGSDQMPSALRLVDSESQLETYGVIPIGGLTGILSHLFAIKGIIEANEVQRQTQAEGGIAL